MEEKPDQKTTGSTVLNGLDPGGVLRGVMDSDTSDLTLDSSTNWSPPSPGELNEAIDVFEVTRLIGRGGMGAVYEARQISLRRNVAVKILPKELSSSPVFAGRFRREARSMAMLEHAGIVSVYDFGQTVDGILYLVMELIEGGHLGSFMRSTPLSVDQKLDLMLQVCDSLQYAHDQGFVHRDLKPSNILVTGNGETKLADFGLAKLIQGKSADLDSTMEVPAAASSENRDAADAAPDQEEDPSSEPAVMENISFQVRNPLNAIIGYSEMLQEDAEETGRAEMAKDLEKIKAAGQHLLELIKDRVGDDDASGDRMTALLSDVLGVDDDMSQITLSGAVVGTGDYMAPEQFEDYGTIDPRTDIYALGVVFYEFLTSYRPRGNWKDLSSILPEADHRFDEIVNRALEPDMNDRFANAGEFAAELKKIRSDS